MAKGTMGQNVGRGWGGHGVSPATHAELKGEPLRPQRESLFTDLQQRVCPHPHDKHHGRGFKTLEAVHSEEEHVSPLAMVWAVLEKAGVPRPKADLTATKNPRSAGGV